MFFEIPRLHPNVEREEIRRPVRCSLQAPAAGTGPRTGLIVFINGYGSSGIDGYSRNFVNWAANRFDCYALTLHYTGKDAMVLSDFSALRPYPNFFQKLNEHHGIEVSAPSRMDVTEILFGVFKQLAYQGMTELHNECLVSLKTGERMDFGLLPALDHLQAVHAVLNDHNPNPRRLYLMGTSYGGYIAGLMLKLAPNTFRMVADNSGFTCAEDDLSTLYGYKKGVIHGIKVPFKDESAWDMDPQSPNFFSPARSAIRNLRAPGHQRPSQTRLYACHSSKDTVIPVENKKKMEEYYEGKVNYELQIVTEEMIDGRLFKSLDHSMGASLRGLFEQAYDAFAETGDGAVDCTDFSLETKLDFPCADETYRIAYSLRDGPRLTLEC